MAEEVVLPIPNLAVPQNLYVLSNPALKHLHEKAKKELLEGIKADGMTRCSINELPRMLKYTLGIRRNGPLVPERDERIVTIILGQFDLPITPGSVAVGFSGEG